MKTLAIVKNSAASVLKYLLAPKSALSSKEKVTQIKGELISIYLSHSNKIVLCDLQLMKI
ncbi:MAG: hypothetical protein JWQ57_2589 [Mucilaginibacter sp.]|nr:hypothetical protein [Mucilaginibacter sp.]